MLIYVCLSSHGFGHASRQAALLAEIHLLRPDYRIVVSSNISRHFLKILFRGIPVEFRSFIWDIGMNQTDAFNINIYRTLEELDNLEEILPSKIKMEADWVISQDLTTVILGDIPYSAAKLSQLIGAKLIWFGNFGWDDIYKPFDKILYKHRLNAYLNYKKGNLLLRCPFSLSMNWNIPEISIGLTVSKPRELPHSFKINLLSSNRPIVMVAFGGLGYKINFELFKLWPDHLFILTSDDNYYNGINNQNNILFIPDGFRVLDVLSYCDRIITKPGYSTYCEAICSSLGIHSFKRRDFIESEFLLNGLQLFSRHRILDEEFLISGNWELDKPLISPKLKSIAKNGAEVAAIEVVKFFES
tara:strand:+ start:119 stop:1192 length:1074 start_codon:yes stop_codon:yes gene_type:complete